jgi:hypothetical protein
MFCGLGRIPAIVGGNQGILNVVGLNRPPVRRRRFNSCAQPKRKLSCAPDLCNRKAQSAQVLRFVA